MVEQRSLQGRCTTQRYLCAWSWEATGNKNAGAPLSLNAVCNKKPAEPILRVGTRNFSAWFDAANAHGFIWKLFPFFFFFAINFITENPLILCWQRAVSAKSILTWEGQPKTRSQHKVPASGRNWAQQGQQRNSLARWKATNQHTTPRCYTDPFQSGL